MHLPQYNTLNSTRHRIPMYRSRLFFTTLIIFGIFLCWLQLIYSYRPFVVTERSVLTQQVSNIAKKDFIYSNIDLNRKIPDIFTKDDPHLNLELNENDDLDENMLTDDLKETLFDREQNYPSLDTSEIFYEDDDFESLKDLQSKDSHKPKDNLHKATNSHSRKSMNVSQNSTTKKTTTKPTLKNQTDHVEKDMKYVLFWTQYNHAPFYFFLEGQKAFIKHNCSEQNCYITTNRTLFEDVTKFDAIGFNGRTMSVNDLPKKRSPQQKYIFFNMESSVNFPVCNKKFDGFFNLTATYKLDSDIPFPYVAFKNTNGDIIGPKKDMHWPDEFPEVDEELAAKLANKTKAAAWFVSHCNTLSGRDQLVKKLQVALKKYNHTVDIYGKCGTLQCPRNETKKCNKQLGEDYFFYMSLENSFAEDYITEKLLTPLQYDTLPIVYGGADYSRFLPPESYLDSKKFDIDQLAATMDRLMKNPDLYKQYFRWKSLYTYIDITRKESVCDVCAAVHRNQKTKPEYDQFRKWWNPNYNSTACKTT